MNQGCIEVHVDWETVKTPVLRAIASTVQRTFNIQVTSRIEGTSCYPQDIAVRLIEHPKMINLAYKREDVLQTTFFQ